MLKNIIALILLGVILISCDLTGPERYKDDMYIITGLLKEGGKIDVKHPIFVGRSATATDSDFSEMYIADAEVYILEYNTEDTKTDSVRLAYVHELGYCDPDMTLTIKESFRYLLKAKIGENLIWAETTVPKHVEVSINEGFTDDENAIFPDLKYDKNKEIPLTISSADNSPVNLFMKNTCLEAYANYQLANDDYEDILDELDKYEYEYYRKQVVLCFTFQPQTVKNGYQVEFDVILGTYFFYGNYETLLYSVDENFHRYNYMNEGYKYGGVNGGMGYFGSFSGKAFYTNLVE
ncbi:MAG: hypothetical protein PHR06_08625 [Candidatus Cloacimonetes bacterium]|nr:hypothetical protein [Candidatus Cloacimonadota bacterium]